MNDRRRRNRPRQQIVGLARRAARRVKRSRVGHLRRPAVSVILPMYNVEDYLADCLDSILGQSFTDFEVLVVDDGSLDGSRAIARS
jgi:CDP-glycerol glycerophosphotransferase